MTIPTIAVKESLDDLKGIGPSTGISGFKLAHVTGKGLYQYQTGDQSSQDFTTDTWVAPSEDTSGKSGAWERIERTGHHDNVISGTAAPTNGQALFFTSASSQYEQKTAATARSLLGIATASPANDQSLFFSSASNKYVQVEALKAPGTSSDPSLAFDTWRTPNANRPTMILVRVNTETDGTSDGFVRFSVDESGGTTIEYNPIFSFADTGLGNGGVAPATISWIIPAGGSYRIENASDPSNNNILLEHREFTL